ncbi:MAG: hypothetical protein HC836_00870 [Richelia sp. RM2_1_2]|nr:hypothetical protein [Richelia sp. SM2_1_7]NJM18335.1 hypothetical protein [Richelia sp. SM1_7_0]NJN10238.1 hypothetical protein [Richelia sp. RM1_1_1]NJO28627.1 hypothetical protein [Richelia sp. SL_2_1]NJO56973.1 hypothetical protein [Richelia sp. RM2_1_2]
MKQQHLRFFNQKIIKIPLVTNVVIASSMGLLVTSGCVNKSPNEVQLEIQGIQREDSNGLYKVVGSTNLPESSRIAVTAVRYLLTTPENTEEIIDDNQNINRSILARQIVEVKQGKWQADLNLWQVAANGNFQEVWQLNRNDQKLAPEKEVSFIATFDPQAQLLSSDRENSQQSTPQSQNLEGKSLRFTNEGEKYVQASQYRSIPLPVGKTVAPPLEPEDFNHGWGNRSQIQAQSQDSTPILPPLTKSQQTSFPLVTSEFLR